MAGELPNLRWAAINTPQGCNNGAARPQLTAQLHCKAVGQRFLQALQKGARGELWCGNDGNFVDELASFAKWLSPKRQEMVWRCSGHHTHHKHNMTTCNSSHHDVCSHGFACSCTAFEGLSNGGFYKVVRVVRRDPIPTPFLPFFLPLVIPLETSCFGCTPGGVVRHSEHLRRVLRRFRGGF